MNRNYKVIWNEALHCFTAVAEYAKSRGKSSSGAVTSNARASTAADASLIKGGRLLRLSTLCAALVAAGLTMSPKVSAAVNISGGTGSGTAISRCESGSGEDSPAQAVGDNAIAIGCNTSTVENFDIVDRGNPYNSSSASGFDNNNIIWDTTAGTTGASGSTAIGSGAQAGNVATGIGTQAKASGLSSVAIGVAAVSKANTSLAIGRQSAALADSAQAIGNVSAATGKGSLAIGHSAVATDYRAIAIGSTDINSASEFAGQTGVGYFAAEQTRATATDSIAFGGSAQATATESVAFGSGARAAVASGTALGANSVANVAGGAAGYAQSNASNSDQAAITATNSTTLGAVSVGTGAADGNRQIVNVAAGTNNSDAVNVAQLKGVSNIVARGLNFDGDSGNTVNRQLNETLNVTGGETDTTRLTNANNIGVVADGSDTLSIKLARNLSGLNSATFGGVRISQSGLDMDSQKITNLQEGSNPNDAVNFSQLDATNTNVTTNTTNISNNSTNIQTNTTNISNYATDIAKGININVNDSLQKTFALGEEIKLNTDNNLTTTALSSGNGIELGLANVVNIGTDNPVQINGSTGTVSGLTNTSFDSTQTYTGGVAATQEQLSQVNSVAAQETVVTEGRNITVTSSLNSSGGQTYNVKTEDEVEFNQVTLGDMSNQTILTSTTNGLDVGGDRITNLSDGTLSSTSTDAINGSQLFETNENVTTNTTNISDNSTDIATNTTDISTNTTNIGTNATNIQTNTTGITTNMTNIAKGIKVNVNGSLQKTFALGEEIKLNTDNNLTTTALSTADGIRLALADVVNIGSDNPVQINGTAGTISGLTNTSFDATQTYTGGVAATQEQLTSLNDNINTAIGSGFDISANGGAKDNVKLSETVNFTNTDGNLAVTNTLDNTINYDLADDIDVTSVTTGAAVLDNSGVQITSNNSANNVSLTSTGLNNGNNVITGVADGDISSTSTDAINGSQLFQTVSANTTRYYSANSTGGDNEFNDGATGTNALALGRNAKAQGGQTIAIGSSSSGQDTIASGQQSIAIGANVVSAGDSSIAIGGDDLDAASRANIDGSTPGTDLNSGSVNTVFRYYAKRDLLDPNDRFADNTASVGAASIAIGAKSRSTGALSTAVGIQSTTEGTAASAFGVAASASKDGSVALGAGSLTDSEATSETTMTINGEVYSVAGNVLDDDQNVKIGAQLSVGSEGFERQIKNVAGGEVSATSTDAINGSQLAATNSAIETNSTTLGQGLDFTGDNTSVTVNRQLGQKLTVKGGATSLTDNNIGVVADDNDNSLSIKLAQDIDLTEDGSVTTGNTVVNNDGISIASSSNNGSNGQSVVLSSSGLDNGGNKVTNVLDGTIDVNSLDAINGSQLFETNENVTTNTTNISNNTTDIETNTTDISTNTTNIGTNATNINKGIKFNVNDDLQKTFALGEEIKLNTDNNLTTTALSSGNGIELGLANVVNIGMDNPVQIDGTAGTISGLTNTSFDATQTYTGGQAATQEQLLEVNNSVNDTVNQGLDFTGDNTSVTVNRRLGQKLTVRGGEDDTDRLATGDNIGVIANDSDNSLNLQLAKDLRGLNSAEFGGGVSISANGLNNGNNKITNVAPGTVPDDGVNFAQLSEVNDDVTDNTTNITTNTTNIETNTTNISTNTTNISNNATDIAKGINIGDGDSDNDQQFALGDTINVTGDSNISTTASATGVQVELNKNIDLMDDGSVTIGNTVVNNDGISIANSSNNGSNGQSVVLSSSGLDNGGNKITNVLDGTIDATSLDAINGSQLFETNENVTTNTTNISNNTTDIETNTTNISTNTTNIGMNATNINKGIKINVNDDLQKTFALGEEIKLNTDSNLTTTALPTGDGMLLGLAPDLTGLNSADFDGVNISSSGIDANSTQITNLASGGNVATNAANIGDIQTAATRARTQVVKGTNVASVDRSVDSDTGQDIYTVNANGASASAGSSAVRVEAGAQDSTTNITDYSIDLSDESKSSLASADTALQTIVTQIDGQDVKTLDRDNNSANFVTGNNIVLSEDDGAIKIATADDLILTSVTTGNTLMNDNGITLSGGDNDSVTLSNNGLNNGGNRITNVDDGTADTDAVNLGQLRATSTIMDQGLNFDGDNGSTINRKMGETLMIKGGQSDTDRLATGNNIGVVTDDSDNSLNLQLAKDLRGLNSAEFGGGVSISANGLNNGNNKITNVAPGTVPDDGVNFAQLSATNDSVTTNTTNITQNTTDIETNTTDITTNTTNINTNATDIDKGIKIGDGDSDNDQQFALGDTINVTGDSNITTTASATGVQVQLNNQLNLGMDGRMQIGNSLIDNDGFTFVNSENNRTVRLSNRGLDNGGNVIRNVDRGVELTDAVNVGQLQEATSTVSPQWTLSAQSDTPTSVGNGNVDMSNADGNISVTRAVRSPFRAVGGNDLSFDLNSDLSVDSVTTGQSSVSDNGFSIIGGPSMTRAGIDAADNKITNVQNGIVSADSQDAINGSQLYDQANGISSIIGGNTIYNAEDGSFTNSNIGGTGQASIDGAIASIKQGETVINNNIEVNRSNIATNTTNIATNTTDIVTNTTNISANTTHITANKDKLDAGLNFGADNGAVINKPIGDGSVLSFEGGNNINTSAEGSTITFDLSGNINVDSVTTGTTTINSTGITMQGGPSMTAQGFNAGNQRVTGVANAVEATDAVNYGQLNALNSRLSNNMSDLGYKIDEVEDEANAGISAAMAMSSLPQAYIIGKSMVGGGIGTYNGEAAVAVGVSQLSSDGRWVIKVNGTADTEGNFGGAVGAGFHFD